MNGGGTAIGGGLAWPGLASGAGTQSGPALCAAACGTALAAWLTGGGGPAPRRGRPLLAHTGAALRYRSGPGSWVRWRSGTRAYGRAGAGSRVRSWMVGLRQRARRPGPEWWGAVAGAVLGLLGHSYLPLIAGAVAVPLTRRWLRAREQRLVAECRETAVIDWCTELASELRAGRQPEQALLSVGVGGLGERGSVVLAAARFGGDVPAALCEASEGLGAAGLRGIAACWQVACDSGAGLADGLDRVAGALQAERDQREDLWAQLAGPRSTAWVLALLPLFGLLLGSVMGAAPLEVLLHTPAGLGCLLLGGLLEWAGLLWVSRIVRGAQPPTVQPSRARAFGAQPVQAQSFQPQPFQPQPFEAEPFQEGPVR